MFSGKCFIILEFSDEDYALVLSISKSVNMTKERFIMEAIKNYILKLQDEWRKSQAQKGGEV